MAAVVRALPRSACAIGSCEMQGPKTHHCMLGLCSWVGQLAVGAAAFPSPHRTRVEELFMAQAKAGYRFRSYRRVQRQAQLLHKLAKRAAQLRAGDADKAPGMRVAPRDAKRCH